MFRRMFKSNQRCMNLPCTTKPSTRYSCNFKSGKTCTIGQNVAKLANVAQKLPKVTKSCKISKKLLQPKTHKLITKNGLTYFNHDDVRAGRFHTSNFTPSKQHRKRESSEGGGSVPRRFIMDIRCQF